MERKGPSGDTIGIRYVEVPPSARSELRKLLDSLHERYGRVDNPSLLVQLPVLGAHLPDNLRRWLRDVRYLESTAALVVRGAPELPDPGPTPPGWQVRDEQASVLHDFWLLLLVGQLGDPVCWSTLQSGRLFGDILPVRGQEAQQTGHGSESELQLHVEDAFSEERCDFLALTCLRDDAEALTTVATVDCLDLGRLDVDTLFDLRFTITPNPEHVRGPAFPGSRSMLRPVLSGDRDRPSLCLDPEFTEPGSDDPVAARALEGLLQQLYAGLREITMDVGDTLLLDNHRAVHGRRGFTARYDGTDRWLRKATAARDLRSSRSLRDQPNSRVMVPR